jgi:3-deoxy-D-manno-octulosonic acid kinase
MIDRSGVPAGYSIERERDAWVVALPSALGAAVSMVRDAGSLYDAAAAAPGAQAFTGRGAAYRTGDWVVRHYRRGGAVARMLTDEYPRIGAPRPLRELRASTAARTRGIDTPEVLACALYPSGIMYRADIATRFIPDARDLADVTFGGDAAFAAAAWRAAGALLRRAFDAGVVHADLNLRNLLVQRTPDEPRAWLLDLDRAHVRDRAVSDVARNSMLARLHRSRQKLERAHGAVTGHDALHAFEDGLRGGAA